MKRILIYLLTAVVAALSGFSSNWTPDCLGDGFVSRYVSQPPDYAGTERSTIIRKLSPTDSSGIGVLYIHGFNDYFFQSEMADRFVARGYSFYAVDLRRYGRSLLPGQEKERCMVRSLDEYFPDIDSALVDMRRSGIRNVILMGHSTGGLVAAYYMNEKRPREVSALILNSPFLDWNLGKKEMFVPVISWLGRWFPNWRIKQGVSDAYAESLLKEYHGEWTYNEKWKSIQSPDVTAGWIRAITLAQKSLRDGRADITVPILLMHSDRSVSGDDWTEEHNRADGVLDVEDIEKYGAELGPHVTDLTVPGGLHDLALSSPPVRAAMFAYLFDWLNKIEKAR